MGKIGQFLLKGGGQARFACYRHDYAYYIRDIMWDRSNPEWEVEWTTAKFAADMELKINRKLVAKNPVYGKIYSILYFRAVRAAASKKPKRPEELPTPPTLSALKRLKTSIDEPLTSRAREIFKTWEVAITGAVDIA